MQRLAKYLIGLAFGSMFFVNPWLRFVNHGINDKSDSQKHIRLPLSFDSFYFLLWVVFPLYHYPKGFINPLYDDSNGFIIPLEQLPSDQ